MPQYQWKARLDLSPSARYCYRIYLGRGRRAIDLLDTDRPPSFRAQLRRDSRAEFSFAVFGDWGAMHPEGNSHRANVISRIAASGARFAVTVGDNTTEGGTQANYGDLQQRGEDMSGVFDRQSWAIADASMPIFPALGNHGHSNANHLINWPQDTAVATSRGRYRMESYCCANGGQGCSPLTAYGIGWSHSGNAGFGKGSACGAAPIPADITQVFHFLRVVVSSNTVTVTPTDELGRVFDVVTHPF